jgi:endonuclease YncB( thermonuclease family)
VSVRPVTPKLGTAGRENRELAVSLNRNRRIFRPDRSVLPRFSGGSTTPGVILAAVGGVASLLAAAWLFIGPSDAPAHAPASQRLSAPASRLVVIDGDTLMVGDHVVRLQGIVAPARGSICRTDGEVTADCGIAAANALASLVRGAPLDCTIRGHDEEGRPEADCRSAGVALSEAMVRDGWARAEGGYADLRQTEAAARAAGRGVWRNPGAT